MSVVLRNVSGLGDVDIVGVGVVAAGAEFTVSDDEAAGLIGQADNFVVVSGAPEPPPENPPTPEAAPVTEAASFIPEDVA